MLLGASAIRHRLIYHPVNSTPYPEWRVSKKIKININDCIKSNYLMQINCNDFFHAIFDVLGSEEICFTLSFNCNLPHVLKQDWGNGFCRTKGDSINFTNDSNLKQMCW